MLGLTIEFNSIACDIAMRTERVKVTCILNKIWEVRKFKMAMALILVVSVLSSNLDLASAFLTSPIVYAAGRKPYGKMFCDMQVCLLKFKVQHRMHYHC